MDELFLQTVDLSHRYGNLSVLNSIDLSLHSNEIVALLGINGAGKSSLLNIITGIIVPSKGDVLIHNKNLFNSGYSIKKSIGYLSENNPLYDDMYVKEYLHYIAKLYLNHGENIKDKVADIIEKTGLTSEYKKKISVLSKGNKQRVGIAQALIHNPDIIILDEPMTGLDVHQQEEIKRLIAELRQDKLILLSSHHFGELEELATRYLILHKGNLVFDKQVEDINDNMYDIFNNLTQ